MTVTIDRYYLNLHMKTIQLLLYFYYIIIFYISEMYRRTGKPRSRFSVLHAGISRNRFAALRMLLVLAGVVVVSIFVYWSGRTSGHLKRLHRQEHDIPWERSAALRQPDELDEDYDEGDLVPDGVTESPDETTVEFDIDRQLQKDVMEFGKELEALGMAAIETEDRHIGVEQKLIQPWEMEVEDLFDDTKDYIGDEELIEDDHIPGLVDDIRPHKHSSHDDSEGIFAKSKQPNKDSELLLDEHRKDSLLEEDLETVARLAQEEAMNEAEDEEWAKVVDVEEAEEWHNEADVDWDQEEEDLVDETNKQKKAEKEGKQVMTQRKRTDQLRGRLEDRIIEGDEEDDGRENWEADEDFESEKYEATTRKPEHEFTTYEPTTPESPEEIAEEEAEEAEIFGAPETRKIERILLKLGIGKNRRLRYALEKAANWKRNVLVTLSDSRYTMMVLNFYENTVLKLGLTNVIFASLDGKLCAKLDALNIPCIVYDRAQILRSDIERGVRKIFNSKIYFRARLILECLAMGYNVAYVDVDTILLKDPFPALREECQSKCDVAFQQLTNSTRQLSWGVAYARPTLGSLYLYYALVKKTTNNTNIALPDKFISRLDRERKLHLARLPLWRFRSGVDYFDYVKFAWDDNCVGCVSIHCDETMSKDAKLFRMKELLMWNLNINNYYSNRRRRYIVYDNPYVFHNRTETLIMEMRSLRNALAMGHILRRVVILPKFHCFVPPSLPGEPEEGPPSTKWCNIHDILRIEDFHRWFMGHYREHSFLAHRKVPRTTKRNITDIYYIGQKMPEDPGEDGLPIDALNVTMIKPKSPLSGAHAEEIRALFEHDDTRILRFHSLYYGFSHFLSDDVARGFNRKIKFGFVFRTRVRYNVKNFRVKPPNSGFVRPQQLGAMAGGAPMLVPPGHMIAQQQIMLGEAKMGGPGPIVGQKPVDPAKLAAFNAPPPPPPQGALLAPEDHPLAVQGHFVGGAHSHMTGGGLQAPRPPLQPPHSGIFVPPSHLQRPPGSSSDVFLPPQHEQKPSESDMFLPPAESPMQPEDTGMFLPPPIQHTNQQESDMFLPPPDQQQQDSGGNQEGFLIGKR